MLTKTIEAYRKIPKISPRFIFVQKGFTDSYLGVGGLYTGRLICRKVLRVKKVKRR